MATSHIRLISHTHNSIHGAPCAKKLWFQWARTPRHARRAVGRDERGAGPPWRSKVLTPRPPKCSAVIQNSTNQHQRAHVVRHDSGDTRLHAEPRHRQPILLRRRSRSSEPKEERRADKRPPSRPRHLLVREPPEARTAARRAAAVAHSAASRRRRRRAEAYLRGGGTNTRARLGGAGMERGGSSARGT